MANLPNLFSSHAPKDASRLYHSFLTALRAASRWDRTVEACRQIRFRASRSRQTRVADFTYYFEIDALCELGNFPVAWRQLRRWERLAFGRNINLNAKSWRSGELDWFPQYHSQILYFHRLARRLFDSTLEKMFRPSANDSSYELLPYVYSSATRPRHRLHVKLFHIYSALDKSLSEWSGWSRFVHGLHPKLLTLAGVKKQELLRDPRLLRSLDEAIDDELKGRLTAGVTDGQRDLTDPARKVKRRQQAIARRIGYTNRASLLLQGQLESIFPELERLPKGLKP